MANTYEALKTKGSDDLKWLELVIQEPGTGWLGWLDSFLRWHVAAGYQDEGGFHYGTRPAANGQGRKTRQVD
jgi:hypothetical protein